MPLNTTSNASEGAAAPGWQSEALARGEHSMRQALKTGNVEEIALAAKQLKWAAQAGEQNHISAAAVTNASADTKAALVAAELQLTNAINSGDMAAMAAAESLLKQVSLTQQTHSSAASASASHEVKPSRVVEKGLGVAFVSEQLWDDQIWNAKATLAAAERRLMAAIESGGADAMSLAEKELELALAHIQTLERQYSAGRSDTPEPIQPAGNLSKNQHEISALEVKLKFAQLDQQHQGYLTLDNGLPSLAKWLYSSFTGKSLPESLVKREVQCNCAMTGA
jgi:hypothetical protein